MKVYYSWGLEFVAVSIFLDLIIGQIFFYEGVYVFVPVII